MIGCVFLFAQTLAAQNISLNSQELTAKVDSLMAEGIAQQAFPGAQVLLYKKGEML